LVERDELRALVAKQFADLAGLRRELDALDRQFTQQLRNLAHRRYQLSRAVEEAIAERLGLTLPARN
jgi:hypothetical protein